MAGPGDGFHFEQLPGVVLHAAEHHHGDGVALFLDHLQDVLRPQCVLALETPTTCSVSRSVTVLIYAGPWLSSILNEFWELESMTDLPAEGCGSDVPVLVTGTACFPWGRDLSGESETRQRTEKNR